MSVCGGWFFFYTTKVKIPIVLMTLQPYTNRLILLRSVARLIWRESERRNLLSDPRMWALLCPLSFYLSKYRILLNYFSYRMHYIYFDCHSQIILKAEVVSSCNEKTYRQLKVSTVCCLGTTTVPSWIKQSTISVRYPSVTRHLWSRLLKRHLL